MQGEKITCAVIGLSDNPERYAYKAAKSLLDHGYKVIGYGMRSVSVMGIDVITDKHIIDGIDTVTIYVGPKNQEPWKKLIIGLSPRRVIFNPGTENPEFQSELEKVGIETVEACTLVMLSIGNF